MSVESRKKQLQDEMQTYKKERMLLCDNAVASILADKEQQINTTDTKLRNALKLADTEILSFRRKLTPKFKPIVFPPFFKKPLENNSGRKQTSKRSKAAKKQAPKYRLIVFLSNCFLWLICLPFVVIFNLIYFIIYLTKIAVIRRYNKKIECRIAVLQKEKIRSTNTAKAKNRSLNEDAVRQIEKARNEAKKDILQKEQKIKEDICNIEKTYEKDVDKFCKGFMTCPDKISFMVDYILKVFNLSYSKVKSEIDQAPLIKSNMKFRVSKEQLIFDFDNHDSETNRKRSDENSKNLQFYKKGFPNLENDSQCEGLARALALMIKKKMEDLSPTMMVTFEQLKTTVNIHTKDINPEGRLL